MAATLYALDHTTQMLIPCSCELMYSASATPVQQLRLHATGPRLDVGACGEQLERLLVFLQSAVPALRLRRQVAQQLVRVCACTPRSVCVSAQSVLAVAKHCLARDAPGSGSCVNTISNGQAHRQGRV